MQTSCNSSVVHWNSGIVHCMHMCEQCCCSLEQQCCSPMVQLHMHCLIIRQHIGFLSLTCFSCVECHPTAMHQSKACNRHGCKDGSCFLHSNSSKLEFWYLLCSFHQRCHCYIHPCSIWKARMVFFQCSSLKNMSCHPKAHMQTLCCVGMHCYQQ